MTAMICDQCQESLLGPKIRQIHRLNAVKTAFTSELDPLAKDAVLLKELVAADVLKPYNVERLKQRGLTRESCAGKLWTLLVRVPENKYFRVAEPLLKRHEPSIFEAEETNSSDRYKKMCLRDVVEIALPLKELAENFVDYILNNNDYYYVISKEEKTLRWARLFQGLKVLKMDASQKSTRIVKKFLKDAHLPEPSNLQDLLAKGLPCVCKSVNEMKTDAQLLCSTCKDSLGEPLTSVRNLKKENLACEKYQLNDKRVPLSEPMFWYPDVCPPSSSKKDVFCISEFADVDSRAKLAPESLRNSFEKLAAFLTEPWTTGLQKVRSIYTWVGAQKIVQQKIEHADPDTPLFYMKNIADGYRGFVQLFVLLCRYAFIPCMTVPGKVKAAGYELGDESTLGESEWVMVCVDSQWRFVQPRWSFCCMVNYSDDKWTEVEDSGAASRKRQTHSDGKLIAHVEEFWFLTDPDVMSVRCLATDPVKQLLTEPLTSAQFVAMPGFKEDYFQSSWQLLQPHRCIVETADGVCSLDFRRPADGAASLRYKLYFDERGSQGCLPQDLQIDTFVMRKADAKKGTLSLVTRLPVVGTYKIEVKGVHQDTTSCLCDFLLLCKSVPERRPPFPPVPEMGFGPGEVSEKAGLSHPSQESGVIFLDEIDCTPVDFRFQVKEEVKVRPRLVHATRHGQELQCCLTVTRDDAEIRVAVVLPNDDPHPEYAVEFHVKPTSAATTEKREYAVIEEDSEENMDGFFNAVSYLLTCDQKVHEACKNEAKEIHQALEEALDADEETLKTTLKRFENNSLYDPIAVNKVRVRQAVYDKIRDDLLAAVRSRSMERIAFTLQQFEDNNLVDDGMIERALQRILTIAENAVRNSIDRRSLDELQVSLQRATGNPRFADLARQAPWFQEGLDTRYQLQTLGRTSEMTKVLTLTAMLFMTEQPRPNNHLLTVVKTVYLLLGEKPQDISSWRDLQSKLRQDKDKSLMQRIQTFRMSRLTSGAVAEAEKLIATVKRDEVAAESSLAAKLYTWCQSIIFDFRNKTD